jgi:hypothetical protein
MQENPRPAGLELHFSEGLGQSRSISRSSPMLWPSSSEQVDDHIGRTRSRLIQPSPAVRPLGNVTCLGGRDTADLAQQVVDDIIAALSL